MAQLTSEQLAMRVKKTVTADVQRKIPVYIDHGGQALEVHEAGYRWHPEWKTFVFVVSTSETLPLEEI